MHPPAKRPTHALRVGPLSSHRFTELARKWSRENARHMQQPQTARRGGTVPDRHVDAKGETPGGPEPDDNNGADNHQRNDEVKEKQTRWEK